MKICKESIVTQLGIYRLYFIWEHIIKCAKSTEYKAVRNGDVFSNGYHLILTSSETHWQYTYTMWYK